MHDASSTMNPSSPPEVRAAQRDVDIFIGGLLDRSSCIVFNYRKMFLRAFPARTTFYFEHDQRREIIATIMAAREGHAACKFNLIGHSWGAVTAIRAANALAAKGIDVEQVITVDPVSRTRIAVMSRSTAWINVNAAPATSNGWSGDYYANLGGKWNDWPRDKATVHYWAPFHHNEFASLFEYVSLDAHCGLHCLIGTGRDAS